MAGDVLVDCPSSKDVGESASGVWLLLLHELEAHASPPQRGIRFYLRGSFTKELLINSSRAEGRRLFGV